MIRGHTPILEIPKHSNFSNITVKFVALRLGGKGEVYSMQDTVGSSLGKHK